MTAHVPRFKARVLTVFLLVGLPILAVGIVIVLAIGQARLSASYGQHLQQVAQQTAAAVDAYVYRRILDVSLLGRSPDIRREAQSSSLRPLNIEAVRTIDETWQQSREVPPQHADVLTSPAARFLADLVSHDTIYREILLTDRYGRLVAASNKTSHYYQGDEDWWKATVEDGSRGRVTMTDVRWDDNARTHAIEIAVPVPEPGGDGLAGVLKIVADSRELLAMVGGVRLGATGEAVLLRENGSIVFSPRQTDPNARYFATDALRDRVAVIQSGGPEAGGFFKANAPPDNSPWLVGLSASQLGRSYPNVAWIVAVSQAEEELLAPVRALGWYLLTVVAMVTIAVLALALYFSMRLAAPQVEEDLHLVDHPAVSHVGDAEADEESVANAR
jgi:hypothetical protein